MNITRRNFLVLAGTSFAVLAIAPAMLVQTSSTVPMDTLVSDILSKGAIKFPIGYEALDKQKLVMHHVLKTLADENPKDTAWNVRANNLYKFLNNDNFDDETGLRVVAAGIKHFNLPFNVNMPDHKPFFSRTAYMFRDVDSIDSKFNVVTTDILHNLDKIITYGG
jgi:hypothetical protein